MLKWQIESMIIAIFPHSKKRQSYQLAIGIREFLSSQGVTVVTEDKDAPEIGAVPLSQIDPKAIDFIISMGGDGTILRLVHQYEHLDAAFLGINMGHLGFMADVPIPEIYPALQDLLAGAYRIEERLAIQGENLRGDQCFAVNDMVIHRSAIPSLIEIAIHVDGLYLNTFEADGLVIATPNGSTAYSLAAGGPIISPSIDALVITPICPHTISNRPIVLPGQSEVQIQYLSDYGPVEIRSDGLAHFSLETGEVFHMKPSQKKFRLVNLLRRDYFSTLRSKLGWVGKLR